ncbi:hypothetical protein [Bacillus pumilus]|uniref:hypothetical protein n=2 Tax=Bacillus pumilus TaxID=1408 RepID=UPI00145C3218|nr:hypothetical protein [Bacillus pumilus]WLP59350.1 hypothetical protein Q8W18_17520 [Bacillus pumilus]
MMKANKLGSFSLLLFAVAMASLFVGDGSLIAANLCAITVAAAAIMVVHKKQGEAKGAAF